jgi:hypothetical protein
LHRGNFPRTGKFYCRVTGTKPVTRFLLTYHSLPKKCDFRCINHIIGYRFRLNPDGYANAQRVRLEHHELVQIPVELYPVYSKLIKKLDKFTKRRNRYSVTDCGYMREVLRFGLLTKTFRVTDTDWESRFNNSMTATVRLESLWGWGFLMKLEKGIYRLVPSSSKWIDYRKALTTNPFRPFGSLTPLAKSLGYTRHWQVNCDIYCLVQHNRSLFIQAKTLQELETLGLQINGEGYPEVVKRLLRELYRKSLSRLRRNR